MTDEQVKAWMVERDIARQSGNPDLVQKAMDHKDEMLMTCVAHQSARVKTLAADVAEIKADLAPCIESDREYRRHKLRAEGAAWMWRVLRYLAAAGGGAAILKLLTGGAA